MFAYAQDSHFSQYEYSPLTTNPALTGIDKKVQVILHRKDQWRSLNGFKTNELSAEMRFDPSSWIKIEKKTAQFREKNEKGFAFGINVFSDKAGDADMQNISGHLSFSYHLRLNESSLLSAGLSGGVEHRSLDPNNLRFNSQYGTTGLYQAGSTSGEMYRSIQLTNADFSGGVCYTYGKEDLKNTENNDKLISIGAAVDHISRIAQTYLQERNSVGFNKYILHAQTLIDINDSNYSLKASAFSSLQGTQSEITMGFFLKYKLKDVSRYTGIKKGMAVSFGTYYRYKDAVIPTLQYQLSRYAIGIGYDINISSLRDATAGRGGLEVTLRFFNPVSYLYQKKE